MQNVSRIQETNCQRIKLWSQHFITNESYHWGIWNKISNKEALTRGEELRIKTLHLREKFKISENKINVSSSEVQEPGQRRYGWVNAITHGGVMWHAYSFASSRSVDR